MHSGYRPGGKRLNGKSKAASTDLARLDIADWLANEKESPLHRTSAAATGRHDYWIPG